MTSPADLKKLQDIWYKKLEKDGFQDIEQDENNLKYWDSYRIRADYSEEAFLHKQNYYRLASQFLHDHEFETPFEKKVWQLHSDGISIRKIVDILKSQKVKVYKSLVHTTISKLAKIMGK